ncbi:hypothetical protein BOTBODRAFT_165591 [Botryobasidium botryosum FD-172 SS1]|uniref:UNC-50-like protein n=1 Tax=Botryobasidium botryosum (strain FD-172 SS1) TaxID=930990 RepID=A0A067MB61_BOTB1|nr:hypothetical protein BOTBODRAFT_165591 [Botryobasidium botryosum FD-172 SS1]
MSQPILPTTAPHASPSTPSSSRRFFIHHARFFPRSALTLTGANGGGRSARLKVPVFFRRVVRFQHLDFELAAWQLTYLCISPRRVYRNVYFHKVQTKNTWARDDPAIIILISAFLCAAAAAWSLTYSLSAPQWLWLAAVMVVRDYLAVGVVVATLLWLAAPLLSLAPTYHHADSRLEWAYAFDIHSNAFFPFALILYVLQAFLAPILMHDRWLTIWLGNTLYLVAFSQYVYVTYLGMTALPFFIRSEIILAPLLPLFGGYIISLLGFNVAKSVLDVYFGK